MIVNSFHIRWPCYVTQHVHTILAPKLQANICSSPLVFSSKEEQQLYYLSYFVVLSRFFHVQSKDWLAYAQHPMRYFQAHERLWSNVSMTTKARFIELFTEVSTDMSLLTAPKSKDGMDGSSNGRIVTEGVHVYSGRMRDKVLSYLLVLALHIDDFSLPLQPLATDLKLSVMQLRTYLKAVGCKVESSPGVTNEEKDIKCASLIAPLVFPKIRIRRQKKN